MAASCTNEAGRETACKILNLHFNTFEAADVFFKSADRFSEDLRKANLSPLSSYLSNRSNPLEKRIELIIPIEDAKTLIPLLIGFFQDCDFGVKIRRGGLD